MKLNKNSILYAALFTFIVCVVFVMVLSVANALTKAQVEANRRLEARFAILKAFGLADAATPPAEVDTRYTQFVTEIPPDPKDSGPAARATVYRATIDGVPAIGVKLTMPGLWGPITAVLATDSAGTVVRGFEIIDQPETPGLGGRISEPWFSAQFKGKKVLPDGTIAFVQGSGKGNFDPENGTVDAITGASRTSDFVRNLVNTGLAVVRAKGGAL
ncbi:MAG: FMN-binding protein [Rectinema sp.]|nr:FMN-binding protein [Rectinema sp.]